MAAAYHQSRTLARAWKCWHVKLHPILQEEQELWERVESFRWQHLLTRAFAAWQGFAQRSAPLRMELADLLLDKAFKVIRGEEPQLWEQPRHQQQLQDSWLAWQSTMQLPLPPSEATQRLRHSWGGSISSSRGNTLRRSQTLNSSMSCRRFSNGGLPVAGGWWRETEQYRVLLGSFERWYAWAQRKAQQRKVLVLVEQHRRVSVCFKVLLQWQQLTIRAVGVAQQQQARKRVLLIELLKVTQQQTRVREFVLQRRVGPGFRTWVEMVRFKAAAAQGFWCYNMQRRCFAAWAGSYTAAGQLLLSTTADQQRQQGALRASQKQNLEEQPELVGSEPREQQQQYSTNCSAHVEDEQQEQEESLSIHGMQGNASDMERARSAVEHWLDNVPPSKVPLRPQQHLNGGILGSVAGAQQEKGGTRKRQQQGVEKTGPGPPQQQQQQWQQEAIQDGHGHASEELEMRAIKAPATPLLGDGAQGLQLGFRRSSSNKELYHDVVGVQGIGVGGVRGVMEATGGIAEVDLLEPYLAILRE
jgi:hypothetical protein